MQEQVKIKDLKPGDKFTVEFEVNARHRLISGTWESAQDIRYISDFSYMSRWVPANIIKAPRVPKAGDVYSRRIGSEPRRIIFIDDKSVLVEFTDGGHRHTIPRQNWDEDNRRHGVEWHN